MLRPMLEDPAVVKILHNAKYDWKILARYGIRMAPLDDTMLLSYALNAALHNHGMDELARLHLGHEPIPFKSVAGTGKSQKSFKHVALKPASEYAAEDADVTLRLWRRFKARLPVEAATARIDRDLRAAAAARDWWYISPLADGWITAENYATVIDTGVGRDHPSTAGHRYLAEHLAAAVASLTR